MDEQEKTNPLEHWSKIVEEDAKQGIETELIPSGLLRSNLSKFEDSHLKDLMSTLFP